VYVPENGGLEAYENSPVYDYKKKVEEVRYVVSADTFRLEIPVQLAGAKFQVYSLDWTDKSSVVTKLVTADVAPNMPRLTQVYAVDNCIYGRIPAAKNGPYEISVTDGTGTYTGTADASGFFAVSVKSAAEGAQFVVTASDTVDGKKRTSAQAKVTVASCDALDFTDSRISFDEIDSKGTLLSGQFYDYEGDMNLLIGKKQVTVTVDANGDFSYTLSKPLAAGTPIVAMVRDTNGSILDASRTTVTLALPEKPELITDVIYDTTEEIEVFCPDKATAVVKVGKVYYKAYKGVYDEELEGYVYTVKIKKKPKAGEPVIIYMMNETGKSGKVKTTVEADPDAVEEEEKDKTKDKTKEEKE